jgi:diguanylate cyclase (GGDEF)-like protein
MKTSMLRTEEGRFLQIIIHDITEYQRAIEEIERLAKFPEENPNPILRVDPEGVILYANAASAVLLHAWGSNTNERLPEEYRRAAAGAYADMETKELEVAVEEQVFLTLFVPVKEFAYINLYGHDITERKRKEEQLNQLATTDSLTGLLNRRHFIALAEQELERSRRFETRFSILMFDIDHFKQVNDTYGHSMGDTVLTSLGTQTRRLFRGIDLMARVGGEEFMVLMPETELEEALRAAERFRRAIADLELEMEGKTLSITVSIGLAALVEPGQALKQIMHHADIALYEAKRAGRNRIRSYIPQ